MINYKYTTWLQDSTDLIQKLLLIFLRSMMMNGQRRDRYIERGVRERYLLSTRVYKSNFLLQIKFFNFASEFRQHSWIRFDSCGLFILLFHCKKIIPSTTSDVDQFIQLCIIFLERSKHLFQTNNFSIVVIHLRCFVVVLVSRLGYLFILHSYKINNECIYILMNIKSKQIACIKLNMN